MFFSCGVQAFSSLINVLFLPLRSKTKLSFNIYTFQMYREGSAVPLAIAIVANLLACGLPKADIADMKNGARKWALIFVGVGFCTLFFALIQVCPMGILQALYW